MCDFRPLDFTVVVVLFFQIVDGLFVDSDLVIGHHDIGQQHKALMVVLEVTTLIAIEVICAVYVVHSAGELIVVLPAKRQKLGAF